MRPANNRVYMVHTVVRVQSEEKYTRPSSKIAETLQI